MKVKYYEFRETVGDVTFYNCLSSCDSPRQYGPNTDITEASDRYYCAESCSYMVPASYKFSSSRRCVEECPKSQKFFNATSLVCSSTCGGFVDMEGRNCSSSCPGDTPKYYDANKIKYCAACDGLTQATYDTDSGLTTLKCVEECESGLILY